MPDRRVIDPVLGTSVMRGRTDTCSKCGGTIDEDAVPLMMWDESGDVLWVFCEECDGKILEGLMEKAKAASQGE